MMGLQGAGVRREALGQSQPQKRKSLLSCEMRVAQTPHPYEREAEVASESPHLEGTW